MAYNYSITTLLQRLFEIYPQPKIELNFNTPLELLVATILSAQATDKKVNEVTAQLFKKYKTAHDYANADIAELQKDISAINFFKNKARMINHCCRLLVERFNGNVPDNLDDLVSLPGVGRKTANVILGNAFKKQAIAVDTHVTRVTNRLGLVKSDNPEEIERLLMASVPEQHWSNLSLALILHGRYTCKAKKPLCIECRLKDLCNYYKAQNG